jgi:hypothetical protein
MAARGFMQNFRQAAWFCGMDHHAAPGPLLRFFEHHLRARNGSECTVGNYLESARLAEAFLEGRGKQFEEATPDRPRGFPG